MRGMGRAGDPRCVCKHGCDTSLTTTPFTYQGFTAEVYWYRPVLSSGISWKDQYRTCAAVVSVVYFGNIWGHREGEGSIWGPAFQGLVAAFPVENEAVRQKRDFCANRASISIIDMISLVDFSFHVTGMVWITIQFASRPFHACLKQTQLLAPTSSCPSTTVTCHSRTHGGFYCSFGAMLPLQHYGNKPVR